MSMSSYLDYINQPVQGIEGDLQKLQPTTKHITLFYDTDTWKIKDHTDEVPAFTALSDQSEYEPPFKIRRINLDSSSDLIQVLNYDKFHNTVTFKDITETLKTCIMHGISASKIYLNNSNTTAILIQLHG